MTTIKTVKIGLAISSAVVVLRCAPVFSQSIASRLENAAQISGQAAMARDMDSSKLLAGKAWEDRAPAVAAPLAANVSHNNTPPSRLADASLASSEKKQARFKSKSSPMRDMLTDGPARGFYGILGVALLVVGITALFPAGAAGGISLLGVGVFFASIGAFYLVADSINRRKP